MGRALLLNNFFVCLCRKQTFFFPKMYIKNRVAIYYDKPYAWLGPDDIHPVSWNILHAVCHHSLFTQSYRSIETFSVINRIYPKNFQVHTMSCTVLHVNIKAQLFHSIEWSSVALCVFRTFQPKGRVFRRYLTTSVDIAGRARHPVITCCCCCYSLQKRALLCQLPFGS